MRRRALLLAILVAAAPGLARGQGFEVVPIAPVPSAEPPAQAPAIEPPADLSGLSGRPVTRISVVLEGNVWDDVEVPPVTAVKRGDPFSPSAAQVALQELLRSRRFARGRLIAQPDGAGVLVTAKLVPRKLIDRLDVEMHEARLDLAELLRASDLSDGGEIVGADVPSTARRIERYFALHGYPAAKATLRMRDTDDPARTLLIVDVAPGAPRLVDQREFYVFGAPRDQILPTARDYAVSAGDRVDEPSLEQADADLAQRLHARGWVRANAMHDLVWVRAPTGKRGIVLRVRIDTGPQQVPRFEGNAHYDDDVLTSALAIETETDRSTAHLADKIRSFYEKRGFLDVQVRVETRGGEDEPVQVIVFHVDEGRRVRVVARRYPCLKLDAIRHLHSGGPSSASDIGTEIDSFLEEDLPGADLLVDPDPGGLSALIGAGAGQLATGAQPTPIDLHPNSTYVADTYERAIEHVQELYRNEGFLHAQVGPVQVVRARCDPRSPPGACLPLPLPALPAETCTYDSSGLPLPADPLDATFTCRPEPSHGVECAPALQVVIPVKLGPRTRLWDVAFNGVKSVAERDVADAAGVPLGEPASTNKLEDARRRVVDWYKELGYYYVDVKASLEPSADNTRARVRFDVTEGEQVIVRDIVFHGLHATQESVVRRRVALIPGRPYRTSDVRKTQERIATLGVFSSVDVSLSEPYVPQGSKTVVVNVTELTNQYVEFRPGFATGEGFRGTVEYVHRNLLGYAWGLNVHVQASYLPNFLILDQGVRANYDPLPTSQRIATRDTITMAWPEMGLGPTVRSQLDAVYVRDLERDFTLFKTAALGTLLWRPVREVQLSGGPEYEHNDVHIFSPCTGTQPGTMQPGADCSQTISSYLAGHPGDVDLQRLLRLPDGDSDVVGARLVLTWDRRDSSFNAHRGTFVALGAEQVNSFPVQGTAAPNEQFESHLFRLTQRFAAYVPLTSKISVAAEVRLGEIVNVAPCAAPFAKAADLAPAGGVPVYCTYPDRLFFMGGFDSMRGWVQDTFIPQEYADKIHDVPALCTDSTSNCQGVPVRGGNLMINPRLELRFPIRSPIDGALFADFGNLWTDPAYIFNRQLTMRADIGAGIRVETPVGPLVFDYGLNVTKRSYEDLQAFHFGIGLF